MFFFFWLLQLFWRLCINVFGMVTIKIALLNYVGKKYLYFPDFVDFVSQGLNLILYVWVKAFAIFKSWLIQKIWPISFLLKKINIQISTPPPSTPVGWFNKSKVTCKIHSLIIQSYGQIRSLGFLFIWSFGDNFGPSVLYLFGPPYSVYLSSSFLTSVFELVKIASCEGLFLTNKIPCRRLVSLVHFVQNFDQNFHKIFTSKT